VSNHRYTADMPDDLDLDDHDEPQSRGLRSSRDGRRAPRGFLHDDDGGGRPRKSVSRRDDGGDERRRANRREAPDNGGPTVGAPGSQRDSNRPLPYASGGARIAEHPRGPYNDRSPRSDTRPGGAPPYGGRAPDNGGPAVGAPGFQRDSNQPLPYASGGARIAERPRGPYNDRSRRSDTRPGGAPPYGGRTPDSRGPGFRTDRPTNTPYRPSPASGRPEGQDRRDGRPMAPRIPGAEARPGVPQQNRYQQQEPRRVYGDRPAYSTRPGFQQTAGGQGFRRPDASPHRPVVQRDDPNHPRSDKPEEEASRP